MKLKFFLLILVIALIPRSIELFSTSQYFASEQGENYLLTKEIVVDHKTILTARQGGIGDFLKPAGFNYILAVPFILSSGNPFGGRVFMFLVSILTVIVTIAVARRMFDPKTSFFIGFLMAISPNLSHYAGRIWPPFIIPILSVLLIFCLYKTLRGNRKFILLMAFIIGLTSHFEMATMGKLSVIFLIVTIFFLIKKKISFFLFAVSIVLLLIPLSPIFISDLLHGTRNITGVMTLLISGTNHAVDISTPILLAILNNRLEVFSWNFLSTFSPNILIWPVILVSMCIGVLAYFKKNENSAQRNLMLSLSAIPIIYFAILIFYPENIVAWWLIELSVAYCFLLGIILGFFWKKSLWRTLTILIIIILFAAFINRTLTLYKNEFLYPHAIDKYIKENEPIKYIFEDAHEKPFNIEVYSSDPPSNYDYLIWWHGGSVKNSKLSYMLFERDYYRLLGDKKINSLLENRTILHTEVFGTGFIVKKTTIR